MELQHLKYEKCTICGSRVIVERKISQHCNGEWFEKQGFECGLEIEYSPNFKSERIYKQCPKHPDNIAKIERRKDAKLRIVKYIKQVKVDDEFKNAIVIAINRMIM